MSAQCQLRVGNRFSAGTATLDPERLTFAGYFRIELPLADIRSIEVIRDILKLETPEGALTLKLGKAATPWAGFIRTHRVGSGTP